MSPSFSGHIEIVQSLLAANANPAAVSAFGTPLDIATDNEQDVIVAILEKACREYGGADEASADAAYFE